jgi:hypothetical protein
VTNDSNQENRSDVCGKFGGNRNTAYAVFVAIPKGKKPFGRTMYRGKDNIEMVYK